ncbi:nucleotide sugar dehydrogenase [Enterococcus plantarum]|uniref:nucleotide sugar dehydrogenase n=1 Tax=Enterococcus plantarum TaxID=1077675 RepID=UPI001A8E2B26|nr:nucleotide sugar dehydrogenase [Enterococcus plantarum]MBO0466740.1 nucleotide sugar dehydrogenase [Enterococcus plantarum]
MKKEVVVIGLGYVGLPSVINHVKKRHKVIGFDVDKRKVDMLNKGISPLDTVSNETVQMLQEKGTIFTYDAQQIVAKDVYIIDVPTPIDKNKIPDLSYIKSVVDLIKNKVKKGSLIILESTTYPGTTEDYLVAEFSNLDYQIGVDLFIAYSPERIDPGNTQSLSAKIPRIVAGHTDKCLAEVKEFFGSHVSSVPNLKTAELAKLYENTFRLVNIALADELQKISDNLDIKVGEVLEAAATKPFGFMKFTPNLGIGGHCIPVDPYYLTWLMADRGVETPLIDTAGKINDSMLDYYLEKINHLASKSKKEFTEMIVAVIGVTYKKNVADIRMSSVISLIKKLKEKNITVVAYDDVMHPYSVSTDETIVTLEPDYQQLTQYDLVIYAVDHDIYEDKKNIIIDKSQLFYDLTTV